MYASKSHYNTPYSKIAAILIFFCFLANWPFWLRRFSNIKFKRIFNLERGQRANFQSNKRLLKCRPFWNKVNRYASDFDPAVQKKHILHVREVSITPTWFDYDGMMTNPRKMILRGDYQFLFPITCFIDLFSGFSTCN